MAGKVVDGLRLAEVLLPGLPGTPRSAVHLRRRLREHVQLPLHRDAYALAVNSAATAAAGLLYWVLAAKTYSAHFVGLNSALISAMMFLSGIASLNLPNILVRFLPESGDRVRARVIWAYAAATAVAACAAVVFIVGVGSWTPRLGFLRSDRGLQAWFVFSTIAWCVFAIQDSVLTALGRAVWVPVENAVFSFVKLILLAGAAAALPRYGIFISWTLAMLVSVAGVNLLIFTRLLRRADLGARGAAFGMRSREFARYFTADYACSVAWLSTINLTPVIVTAVGGATTNAYWALPYAVAMPLYGISLNIGTSLMLHGSADRAALPALVRKAAIQGARVLVPSVLALAVLAPYVLSLFGPDYVERSTTVLRLLAIGVLPNFLLVLAVYVARVQRRLRRAVFALVTQALITLGLATPLIHALGVTGVGIGWAAAQSVVALWLMFTWRRSFRVEGASTSTAKPQPIGPPDDEADTVPERRSPAVHLSDPEGLHPVLGALFARLEGRGVGWVLLRTPSNLAAPTGDVDLLVAPEDAASLREIACEIGFVPLPGWESAPDLILMQYDRPTEQWLLLDVSTSVSFRSPRSWELPGATEHVLRGRSFARGMALPADSDAFWLRLLHCLLDKGNVAPHHRAALRRLAPVALESPLGAALCAAAGPAFTPSEFVDAAQSDGDDALTALGVRLATELRRRRGVRARSRVLLADAARIARKPMLVRRRRGLGLALLGPNGVGKSTAAAELRRSLPFDVRIIYMGMWKMSAKPRGRVATTAEIAIRPLRIWGRYLRARYHELRGRLVVFDRYVYDALLPASPPLLRAKRAYFRFLARSLPSPCVALFLDVPGNVAYGRKPEALPEELESERRLYGELTKRSYSVELIDASADPDTVRADITAVVWRELALRWRGARAGA